MSELIQDNKRKNIRWMLLLSASAVALTSYAMATTAEAQDDDRPTVWIELGGQLSRLGDGEDRLFPGIMSARPAMFESSEPYQRAPLFSFDEVGKITIQPEKSDWSFSASVQYGRSSSKKHVHQQTYPKPFVKYYSRHGSRYVFQSKLPLAAKFSDTKVQNSESHLIVDFQAGKDVGLGLFGNKDATSVVSAGVRIAQFTSRSNISLKSDPDWHFSYKYVPPLVSYYQVTSSKAAYGQLYHSNQASLHTARSFHGIGPSISWKASMPVIRGRDDETIDVDWGVNAAVLFGRQRADTHHQTTGRYHSTLGFFQSNPHMLHVTYQGPAVPDHTRARNVTVPNIGGSIGLSWHLPNFKVSMGYRADFFLGAMDGGIDTHKSYDRNFYGPYATISIGLP